MSTEEAVAVEVTEDVVDYKAMYEQEKAKAGRILNEKKNVKDQFESLQTQLDEIKNAEKQAELAKLSIEDRYKTELQEKSVALEDYQSKLSAQEKKFEQLNRRIQVQNLTNDIPFAEGIPADLKEFSINKAFEGVDLNDVTAIHEAKQKFTNNYKSLILAKTPASGGSQEKAVGASNEVTITNDITPEQYLAMSRDERAQVPKEVVDSLRS